MIDLIKHYSQIIFLHIDKIETVELVFGGNHGKGAFTFMFVVIVRYRGNRRTPGVHEFQLGQIDTTKDNKEILAHLMEDMASGVMAMQPNDGQSILCASKQRGSGEEQTINVSFCKVGEEQSTNGSINILTRFYLMGDIKLTSCQLW